MGKQPTGSGGEPSSPNCETSAEVRLVNFASDSSCLTRGLAQKRTTPQTIAFPQDCAAQRAVSGSFAPAWFWMLPDMPCQSGSTAPRPHCGTARGLTAAAHGRLLLDQKKRADRARNKAICTTNTVQIPNPQAPTALFLFTPPGSAGYRAPPAHPLQSRRSAGSRRWAPPSRSFRRRRTPQAAPGTSGPRTRPPRPRRRPC